MPELASEVVDKRETVLIVEDHPATAKIISSILEKDYKVISASNGMDALEFFNQETDIDLILLDIVMPGMTGYEVCEILKEDPATADIPIIFLTMLDTETDEAKGFTLGVDDYIIKPIMPLRLKTRIRNQLELKRRLDLINKKNSKLQKALDHINTLHGILPICSYCKQIRDEEGAWKQVEEYVRDHTAAVFSHGICPDCVKQNFPDFSSTNP